MNATLYLDHRHLELSLHGQSLHIHREGELERTLPLRLIEHIVCHASVGIKTSLLANLANQGIGLTCFGGRHARHATHLGPGGTQDVNRRIAQYRLYLDQDQRLGWAIRLMQHKLLQQLRHLHKARRKRPDQRHALSRGIDAMRRQYQQLCTEPPTSIQSLRGIEGSAGRFYFQAYASLFPDSLSFHGRQRRPPPDPVNALLSLGYTLLHGDVQNVIESVGLDPWLGLYHEPAHGRPSLVCDLVEPYRPRIDALVWSLLGSRTLGPEHFGGDTSSDQGSDSDQSSQTPGACLLNKAGRAIFYPLYQAHAREWRTPMRQQMLRIAQAMHSQHKEPATIDTSQDIPF